VSLSLSASEGETDREGDLVVVTSRRDAAVESLQQFLGGAALFATLSSADAAEEKMPALKTEQSELGFNYDILKEGNGPAVEPGDLVMVRFRAKYKETIVDDLFKRDNPYYARAGGGYLVKGLEWMLLHMKVGDRWRALLPASLAFGDEGLKAGPGRPRIPPGAKIEYEIAVLDIPGKTPLKFDIGDDQLKEFSGSSSSSPGPGRQQRAPARSKSPPPSKQEEEEEFVEAS